MKLLILFVFFFQCSEKVNYKTFEELVSKHPSSFSNNYFKDKSWVDRIYNIDDIHIDYVMQMNKIDGFKELPTKTKSLNSEKEKFNSISKTFSKELNSMIEEYVYAIYFCENLGGSGLTGYIYDQDTKKPKGGFIILDSKVLNKKANEWISYKENTVFKSSQLKLEITIEDEKNNTAENALRYIFIHELGHIISNSKGYSPDVRFKNPEFTSFTFFQGIWKLDNQLTEENSIMNLKSKIKFYSDKNKILLDEDWKQIYPILQQTNFSTLYGSTNAGEHFAESFVSYIHTEVDKRPWKLIIKKRDSNKIIYEMENLIKKNQFEKEFFKKNLFL